MRVVLATRVAGSVVATGAVEDGAGVAASASAEGVAVEVGVGAGV